MPSPSRWMLRISFVCLLLGFLLGAVLLVHKAYPLHPTAWMLLPVHIELVLFGWIIQFTLGTAYWMLPRYLKAPQRGSQAMAFVMVGLLNFGILFVIIGSLFSTEIPMRLFGRVLELASVLLFVRLHWGRIVTYRRTGGA